MSRIKISDLCKRTAETLAVGFDFYDIPKIWNREKSHRELFVLPQEDFWWNWGTRVGCCRIAYESLKSCDQNSEFLPIASLEFCIGHRSPLRARSILGSALDDLTPPANPRKPPLWRSAFCLATPEDADLTAWWVAWYIACRMGVAASRPTPTLPAMRKWRDDFERGVYRTTHFLDREHRQTLLMGTHTLGHPNEDAILEDGLVVEPGTHVSFF